MTDLLLDTLLKKLKKSMLKDGINAYIAEIDENGELKATPIKGKYKIIPLNEFEVLQNLIKKYTHGK